MWSRCGGGACTTNSGDKRQPCTHNTLVLEPTWTDDKEGQIEFAAGGPKAQEHFLKTWRDTAARMIGK
jgi:hypothetical protein